MNTVIESRVDSLNLAECCLGLESQGVKVTSKANLVATCVSILAEIFVQNGAVPRVEDREQAAAIIERTVSPRRFDAGAFKVGSFQKQILEEVEKLKQQRKEEN